MHSNDAGCGPRLNTTPLPFPFHSHPQTPNPVTHTVLPEDGPAGAVAMVELSRKSGLPLGVLPSRGEKEGVEPPTRDGTLTVLALGGVLVGCVGLGECGGLSARRYSSMAHTTKITALNAGAKRDKHETEEERRARKAAVKQAR